MSVRFGRYELVRRLGRGGMAEVFLARLRGPEQFEKQLVIKRVLPEKARDRKFLDLFIEEARTHVSLSNGNLVPVFDFGRVGNTYFIAMEHVAGVDLATLLRGDGRLPPELVAYVGIELCRGLSYVHRRRLVHRDVTPRNVLLSVDGEVKLSDFGVALAHDSPSATEGVRGTLAYMAPEQARAEPLDGRADLYALGLVLAEACTGQRARPQAAPEITLQAARTARPIVIDGPLADLVARATQPDIAARFSDADEMMAALAAVARALPAASNPARQLAARVAAHLPAAAEAPPLDADPTVGPETYFRDAPTADDALRALQHAPATPPSRRSRALLLAVGLGGLVALSTAIGWRALRSRPAAPATGRAAPEAPRPVPPAPEAPRPMPPAPAAPVTPPSAPAAPTREGPVPGRATKPETGPDASQRSKPTPGPARQRPPAPAPAMSTVHVQCRPWCVAYVDGNSDGVDGRAHALRLAAGRHVIAAERLEDRQQRTVDVAPGTELDLSFDFP